eukprot:TRINITY_DN2024_c0_g1_i1.p1 TRINITY_DN2024_c0_g1~~TRINITY_DN2024_c0_g1_i1.p1  ORF type:complete len:106 (-),score=7.83 TRINITY_DN2024_c0_g1_i1:1167-1484(-)
MVTRKGPLAGFPTNLHVRLLPGCATGPKSIIAKSTTAALSIKHQQSESAGEVAMSHATRPAVRRAAHARSASSTLRQPRSAAARAHQCINGYRSAHSPTHVSQAH